MQLSQKQKNILIGILLGDAHIQQRSLTGNSRLKFTQSIKFLPYFNDIFSVFKPFCTESYTPKPQYVTSSVNNDKKYVCIGFTTRQLPCFNEYISLFYNNNIKIVPNNIDSLLTVEGLAHWIMNDGSKQNSGVHLSTYGFNPQEVLLLVNVLILKFNLNCSIHKHKAGDRIYIKKESMNHLRDLVQSYFNNNMLYKIIEK